MRNIHASAAMWYLFFIGKMRCEFGKSRRNHRKKELKSVDVESNQTSQNFAHRWENRFKASFSMKRNYFLFFIPSLKTSKLRVSCDFQTSLKPPAKSTITHFRNRRTNWEAMTESHLSCKFDASSFVTVNQCFGSWNYRLRSASITLLWWMLRMQIQESKRKGVWETLSETEARS